MERKRDMLETAILAGAALALTSLIGVTKVKGRSMEGTISEGDYLLFSSKAYWRKKPCRGDIVVVNSNLKDDRGNDKKLLKRVIGLPGEKIVISGGAVFIDGTRLDEEYISSEMSRNEELEIEVPEGSIFVMGDNREYSIDSRSPKVGTLKVRDVYGKAVARIWPLKDRKLLGL